MNKLPAGRGVIYIRIGSDILKTVFLLSSCTSDGVGVRFIVQNTGSFFLF